MKYSARNLEKQWKYKCSVETAPQLRLCPHKDTTPDNTTLPSIPQNKFRLGEQEAWPEQGGQAELGDPGSWLAALKAEGDLYVMR